MSDTQNNNTLPENADKILFAEDFMSHILFRCQLSFLHSEIAEYRDFIHNAFNAEVRHAANCAYEKFEKEMEKEFNDILESITKANMDSFFSNYAIPWRIQTGEVMRSNEYPLLYKASQFLEFCVKISTLAEKIYIDCEQGFQDAPCIAVDNIISLINDIDMFEQGWWEALNSVAANYSQSFMHTADNYQTPITSDSDSTDADTTDCSSSESSSKDSRSPDPQMNVGDDQDEQPKTLTFGDFYEMCSSEDPRSSDHAMDVGVDQNEQPEKLTNNDLCKTCIAAIAGPASSSSICKHVEKTIDVKTENIVSIPDNTSDSLSSGSPKETSSEDDTSKQNIRKKRKKNPSNSYSKDSDSD